MQNIPFLKDMHFEQKAPELAQKVTAIGKNAATVFAELMEKHAQQTLSFDQGERNQEKLFDEIFQKHETKIDKELATAHVSTDSHILEKGPETPSLEKTEAKEVLKPAETTVHEDTQPRPEDTRISHDDFDEMRDDLKGYGFSDAEIEKMEEQIDTDKGLTWGQFAAQLEAKIAAKKTVSLSQDQQQHLVSFLGKLGFSKKDSAKLVKQFVGGDGPKALEAIIRKLESLPASKKLMFTKNEAESFAAAMNTSEEFTADIKKILGKEALPKDIKEAFSLLSKHMEKADAKDIALARAVGETLSKALSKELRHSSAAAKTGQPVDMKERVEKTASSHKGKAEVVPQKSVENELSAQEKVIPQKNTEQPKMAAKGMEQQAQSTKEATAQAHAPKMNAVPGEKMASKGSAEKQSREEFAHAARLGTEPRENKNGQQAQHFTGQHSSQQNQQRGEWANQPFMNNEANEKPSEWKDFFGKLQKDDKHPHKDLSSLEARLGKGNTAKTLLSEHTVASGDVEGKMTRAWEKISAPKVMKQLTEATIKNLGQGKKQLTLHLKPEELGAVKLIMQVKGKEVHATLRAESPEAAKLIAENLEAMRQNLENQGLKVSKLDVQTGLADHNSAQNWHGEQQHNLAQEREAMSRMRERMRNLRGADTDLAHNMQSIQKPANAAEQGLHLIA